MPTPNYGIDAPRVIRNLFIAGMILVFVSFAQHFRILFINVLPIARITGIILIAEALLMLLYSKVGKFYHRDRMLNMLQWKGSETVLDVGTGAGLLMNGAAKRLTTGKSIGIDIWSARDLSANTAQRALDNAAAEGVTDKVEVRSQDICNTSFSDGAFDVILSNLCLHNIEDKQLRQKACAEIARTLKPGGTALISDFKYTGEYADECKKLGLKVEKIRASFLTTFPPLAVVKAVKV